MEYIILTRSARVKSSLAKEGISSMLFDFIDETAIENFLMKDTHPLVIIMGVSSAVAVNLNHQLIGSGRQIMFYSEESFDAEVSIKPLSELVGTTDAEKIECVAKNFVLKPHVPQR